LQLQPWQPPWLLLLAVQLLLRLPQLQQLPLLLQQARPLPPLLLDLLLLLAQLTAPDHQTPLPTAQLCAVLLPLLQTPTDPSAQAMPLAGPASLAAA
jgi:hypothetical protein